MVESAQTSSQSSTQTGKFSFFISYRRSDNADFVEHIRSWFGWRYGRADVFMDFDSIPAGTQFPDHIRQEIKRRDAVLAIIGPDWVKAIRENPFDENDWVRIELREALESNKLVVPICIKGAPMPRAEDLPKELRGLLNIQAAHIEGGQRFANDIELAITTIHKQLEDRLQRKTEFEKLDANSPAAGLALGYFVNFVEKVGTQLAEAGTLKIGEELVNLQAEAVSLHIIIPPRLALLTPAELAPVRSSLGQATLQSGRLGRPLTLFCRRERSDWHLVDFPTTASAIEIWLRRRMKIEGINAGSEEAQRLEAQELARFESVLRWWIDDQANDPAFRERLRVMRFTSEKPALRWLADAWKQ